MRVFLLMVSVWSSAYAQLSTEQARAKLKAQVSVLNQAMAKGSSIHVQYQLYVSTFSQTVSEKDTALIDIKKIHDKMRYTIGDEHVMLSAGNRSLYYFVPQNMMQYSEDTLNAGDQLENALFTQLLPYIDSAKYVLFEQDKNSVSYELKYPDSSCVYQSLKMKFDSKTGTPLSMIARFTQTPFQPYADMQVYYKVWDKSFHEKAAFPYFEKYITKTADGYAPLPNLGQVKYTQFLKPKK